MEVNPGAKLKSKKSRLAPEFRGNEKMCRNKAKAPKEQLKCGRRVWNSFSLMIAT